MNMSKWPCADLFLSRHLRSVLSGCSAGGSGEPAEDAVLQHGGVSVSGSVLFLLSSWTERYHTYHTAWKIMATS